MTTSLSAGALLTTREAARRLGIAAGTLCNQRSRGEGPPFIRLGAKSIRYSPEDLDRFVSQNRHRAAA